MIINSGNLKTLGTSFSALFQGGLGMAPTDHLMVAMEVPSTTAAQEYGWLGKLPSVREWLGDRVIQNLKTHDYTIRNKDFELKRLPKEPDGTSHLRKGGAYDRQ